MMNETASSEEGGPTLPSSTTPKAFPLSVCGNFDSEDQTQMLANNVYAIIRILGSYIDLERPDGLTVALRSAMDEYSIISTLRSLRKDCGLRVQPVFSGSEESQ